MTAVESSENPTETSPADRVVIFSPRPAHIERIVDVPFPRPRTEELKTSVPFMEMRREIWSMLKQHVTI